MVMIPVILISLVEVAVNAVKVNSLSFRQGGISITRIFVLKTRECMRFVHALMMV